MGFSNKVTVVRTVSTEEAVGAEARWEWNGTVNGR